MNPVNHPNDTQIRGTDANGVPEPKKTPISDEACKRVYYIDTGAMNVMYTLRTYFVGGANSYFLADHYVCNLSLDLTKAEEKAEAYVQAMRERQPEVTIVFIDGVDHAASVRRPKMSMRDTIALEKLESGILPFGKHAGLPIMDAPDSYILFFADKQGTLDTVIMNAIASACMGVALIKGLIAKREVARAERLAVDIQSEFVGKPKDRIEIDGVVVSAFSRFTDYGVQWITKIRVGHNLFTYFGDHVGKTGFTVKGKATVKSHNEYQGVKSTVINRPAFEVKDTEGNVL